jgi:hypothetical protein
MADTFQLTAFVLYDYFRALPECFCVSLLYEQGFFVMLFLLKRISAVSDLPAHFKRFVARFGKGCFGITA